MVDDDTIRVCNLNKSRRKIKASMHFQHNNHLSVLKFSGHKCEPMNECI